MQAFLYYLVFLFWFCASLLPLRVLYIFSDFLFCLVYYVVRYRRKVVRKNLSDSFPDKTLKEIIHIEKQYYSFFCDYIVETIKLFSMGREQMKRRMTFEGLDMVEEAFRDGRSCALYLGHYCNWEWISSFPLHFNENVICGQIYHALENKWFDRLFLYMRGRFGAHSIEKEDTFRTILSWNKAKINNIVGYISDQVPGYNNIHRFIDFLHHPETPVFTGAERISRILDTAVFYGDITRPKRGYYHCRVIKIADHPKELPQFKVTEQYFHLLEENIYRAPQYWLWSHNRWKRTREEFEKMFTKEEQEKHLSRL